MITRPAAWTAYTVLLLVAAWVCFGSLRHHGVYFHDEETFADNEAISRDLSSFFSEDREHRPGRPAAALVKWITFSLTGNRAGPAHLVVVLFHTLASLLLAAVCARTGAGRPTSWLAGFLFLVNVAHFQSVHHISALDFQLATILAMLAWLSDQRQRETGGAGWSVATAACLAAGVASHLAVAATWGLLVITRWQDGTGWRQAVRLCLPVGVLAGAVAVVQLWLTPADTTTWRSLDDALGDWPATVVGAARMLAWMAARLVTTAHWLPIPLYEITTAELALGAAVILGLAVAVQRRRPSTGPWAAWTLLFLAPFALISERITTDGLEGPSHYLYPASAGASALLAILLARGSTLIDRRRAPWGLIAVGAAVTAIAVSSGLTLKRLESMSYYNSGRFLFSTDSRASVAYLRRAVADGEGVIPLHEAYLRLVLALPLAGEDPYPVLREGIERFPGSFYLHGAMGIRELDSDDPQARDRGRQRLDGALEVAEEAGQRERFGTNIAALCHNTGGAYITGGNPARAIRTYELALPLNPVPEQTRARMAIAYRQLAEQLAADGRNTRAEAARRRARELEDSGAVERAAD